MLFFYSLSALSQSQLLGGQSAQAANPVGFSGGWLLPGPAPLVTSPDIMHPGSTHLPETPRLLLPLSPMGPPGPNPLGFQLSASPASFPVACPPGGPGAPCPSALTSTGVFTPLPGQSSFCGFFLGVIALSRPPHHYFGSLLPQANELRPFVS